MTQDFSDLAAKDTLVSSSSTASVDSVPPPPPPAKDKSPTLTVVSTFTTETHSTTTTTQDGYGGIDDAQRVVGSGSRRLLYKGVTSPASSSGIDGAGTILSPIGERRVDQPSITLSKPARILDGGASEMARGATREMDQGDDKGEEDDVRLSNYGLAHDSTSPDDAVATRRR